VSISRSVLEGPVRGAALSWSHRHCTPLRLSRGGCSCQFGRASAPTMPQAVYTMRGPNVGAGTSSGQASALMIARWYPAAHVERPHAVRPHVAERHWLDRVIEASGRHARGLGRLPPAWQDNQLAGVESVRGRSCPAPRHVGPPRSWRSGAGAGLRAIRARGPPARLRNRHQYARKLDSARSSAAPARDPATQSSAQASPASACSPWCNRTVVRTTLAPGRCRRVRLFARPTSA
jgi:hypothetical protein